MTMQVDKARLDEMLEGLEGVTPGPWDVHEGEYVEIVNRDIDAGDTGRAVHYRTEIATISDDIHEAENAAHIARCDPDTMRSIITELLELRSLRSTEGKERLPYAHEFGKSNGDGTYCVVIERGTRGYADRFAVSDWPIKPLYATPEAAEAHVAKLREATSFLIDRLDDFENGSLGDDIEDACRDFDGHVSPALERARAALTRSPE